MINSRDADDFAERTHKILSLPSAECRDVKSLQTWLDGNRCLAREETAYLAQDNELFSLAPVTDRGITTLEAWVEDKLIRYYGGFRSVRETPLLCLTSNRQNYRVSLTTSLQMHAYIYIPVRWFHELPKPSYSS